MTAWFKLTFDELGENGSRLYFLYIHLTTAYQRKNLQKETSSYTAFFFIVVAGLGNFCSFTFLRFYFPEKQDKTVQEQHLRNVVQKLSTNL